MAGAIKLFSGRTWPATIRIAATQQIKSHCRDSNTSAANFKSSQHLSNCTQICCPEYFFHFHQIEPNRRQTNQTKLLQVTKTPFTYITGRPRSFLSFKKKDKDPKVKRRVPRLILLQNPFRWILIKIDFSVLRNIWDPDFTEKEFKYGTKQAISRITRVISDGQYDQLNGLLTRAARLSLMRDLDRGWGEKQRSLLALDHEDIQITSPRKVYFIRIADKKYCDVDMAFLALKWVPVNRFDALIFTEIFAKFHREYTPHCIPEWTIAYFKVTRFQILRKGVRD